MCCWTATGDLTGAHVPSSQSAIPLGLTASPVSLNRKVHVTSRDPFLEYHTAIEQNNSLKLHKSTWINLPKNRESEKAQLAQYHKEHTLFKI